MSYIGEVYFAVNGWTDGCNMCDCMLHVLANSQACSCRTAPG